VCADSVLTSGAWCPRRRNDLTKRLRPWAERQHQPRPKALWVTVSPFGYRSGTRSLLSGALFMRSGMVFLRSDAAGRRSRSRGRDAARAPSRFGVLAGYLPEKREGRMAEVRPKSIRWAAQVIKAAAWPGSWPRSTAAALLHLLGLPMSVCRGNPSSTPTETTGIQPQPLGRMMVMNTTQSSPGHARPGR
jgi:hypothetical protein